MNPDDNLLDAADEAMLARVQDIVSLTPSAFRQDPSKLNNVRMPKVQEAIAVSKEVSDMFNACYGGKFRIIHTHKLKEAVFDGFVVRGDEAIATVEIKTRNRTYQSLRDSFGSDEEIILSFNKVVAGFAAQRLWGIGMVALIYCTLDKTLLVYRLIEDDGLIAHGARIAATWTSAGPYGGQVQRNNLFFRKKDAVQRWNYVNGSHVLQRTTSNPSAVSSETDARSGSSSTD